MTEKQLQYHRQWCAQNRERTKASYQKWALKNPEKLRSNRRRYAESANLRAAKWYQENKERVHLRNQDPAVKQHRKKVLTEWTKNNMELVRGYRAKQFKTNLQLRLRRYIAARIWRVLKGSKKSASTERLIGTTISNLMNHLSTQFRDGMNWQNQGVNGWHIDHIIPCSSFDLTDPEQQRRCFHYTNLQPLWWHENLAKGKKLAA
jgi:Prasinovirus endonuclease VII